jgi:hypothetical protein
LPIANRGIHRAIGAFSDCGNLNGALVHCRIGAFECSIGALSNQ